MAWVILIASGMLEAVWATALGKAEGFTRPGPSIVFLVALALSMVGLSVAMRDIPVATAYAIWVGIGAALTAAYAMTFDGEPVSAIRIAFLLGIVACVVGLKVAS
jgi:quaternary ammonium compound-resistance protein SugE